MWYRPETAGDEHTVATALADMAIASLSSEDGRTATASGAARALELLKQDVALLESALVRESQNDSKPRRRGNGPGIRKSG
jgi:hypothetical protein